MSRRLGSEGAKEASILSGAKYTNISGGHFTINTYDFRGFIWWLLWLALPCAFFVSKYYKWTTTAPATSFPSPSLSILFDKVAVNAVSDRGGRAEDAKCHPGTRVEVISLIEEWIDARDRKDGFLWLSGPAGAGKTAILKTVAERAKERDVHTVNFFFFRGDPTRNHARPLVATLLYQLVQLFPAARDIVAAILATNPLILKMSIQDQFNELILPLIDVIQGSSQENTPIVLLIDGLDECGVDDADDRHRAQDQLLRALDTLVSLPASPFLALIGSRPEPHIHMTFNQLTSTARTLFLDARFAPDADIRLFLAAEFARIAAAHPRAHLLPPAGQWPPAGAVDALAAAASGQFIYAATVMRFLARAAAVPSLSLDRVRGVVPAGRNSPFGYLDAIYTYILGQADDSAATRHILAAKLLDDATREGRATCTVELVPYFQVPGPTPAPAPAGVAGHDESGPRAGTCPPALLLRSQQTCQQYSDPSILPLKQFLRAYNPRYTSAVVESCLADLAALARLQDGRLVFYHASFTDFLKDPARSGLFHVDLRAFAQTVPAALLSGKQRRDMLCRGKVCPRSDVETITATTITASLLGYH